MKKITSILFISFLMLFVGCKSAETNELSNENYFKSSKYIPGYRLKK